MKWLSARSALLLMGALTLLFCLWVLLSGLSFSGTSPRLIAGAAPSEAVLLGRDERSVSLELLPGEQIDLNRATAEEMKRLPGIGDALAQAIVDYREENGPFTAVEELLQVPGIGQKRLAAIRDLVTVTP